MAPTNPGCATDDCHLECSTDHCHLGECVQRLPDAGNVQHISPKTVFWHVWRLIKFSFAKVEYISSTEGNLYKGGLMRVGIYKEEACTVQFIPNCFPYKSPWRWCASEQGFLAFIRLPLFLVDPGWSTKDSVYFTLIFFSEWKLEVLLIWVQNGTEVKISVPNKPHKFINKL